MDDEEYYWVYKNWQLSGSQREYTISKSYYQQYEDCDYYWFEVSLDAINFMNTGECLAFADKWDSYYAYNWRSDKKFDKKEHLKIIIEGFKNNSQK